MGRGRQKAKQTKVARDLKYQTGTIDVTALQRELGGEPTSMPAIGPPPDDGDGGEDDEYLSNASPSDDEPDSGRAHRSLRR